MGYARDSFLAFSFLFSIHTSFFGYLIKSHGFAHTLGPNSSFISFTYFYWTFPWTPELQIYTTEHSWLFNRHISNATWLKSIWKFFSLGPTFPPVFPITVINNSLFPVVQISNLGVILDSSIFQTLHPIITNFCQVFFKKRIQNLTTSYQAPAFQLELWNGLLTGSSCFHHCPSMVCFLHNSWTKTNIM